MKLRMLPRAQKEYAAYFFDLDGTIFLGDRLLPTVDALFTWLDFKNIPYAFLTNNPTRSVSHYEQKLAKLGLQAEGRVMTSTTATVAWLVRNQPHAKVYPIAEAPVIEALQAAGIAISEDPKTIDIVLASFDRAFHYEKLDIAFRALAEEKRAILVATNPDRYCPMASRLGVPDAAAIIGALEACTLVKCSHVFGKPAPALVQMAAQTLDVAVEESIMVGDRLYTDIAMAHAAGMDGALVLTGDSTREDASEASPLNQPALCLESINGLIPSEFK